MSGAKAGTIALVLAMVLACASDLGETSAPPAGIPHPELAELEPPLARELEARRAELDALLTDEASTAKEQAQAFGELGRLDRAEESLARSGTTRVAMADPLMHELTTLAIGASPHLTRGNAAAPDASLRDGPRALAIAAALLEADNAAPKAETAATALAEVGRFEEAINIQRTLIQEARRLERAGEERRLARNLDRYERGEACCGRVADVLPPY